MESRNEKLNKIAPPHVRARAVDWVTDWHGPKRTAKLEKKIARWIARDPRHAAAYEWAMKSYRDSGNLPAPERFAHSGFRLAHPRWLALCAAALIAATVAAIYLARDATLATGPDQRRTVELTDGTQVALNANTRLRVEYDGEVRKVILQAGDALFDVSKNQPRPFVVVAGDRKIVALGTSFMVRREKPADEEFAVTLVEGRVAVEPASWPDVMPTRFVAGVKLLSPGERLKFVGSEPATVDLPSIDTVTAWRHDELIFDDTSLREAAEEFNRYNSRKLLIKSATVGRLRVGGVFRIGDPLSFAQAMASTYHLRLIEHRDDIILTDDRTR